MTTVFQAVKNAFATTTSGSNETSSECARTIASAEPTQSLRSEVNSWVSLQAAQNSVATDKLPDLVDGIGKKYSDARASLVSEQNQALQNTEGAADLSVCDQSDDMSVITGLFNQHYPLIEAQGEQGKEEEQLLDVQQKLLQAAGEFDEIYARVAQQTAKWYQASSPRGTGVGKSE